MLYVMGGGCLVLSFFGVQTACADTIFLKNGKELKGLVVEQHEDRILLSTEKGEMPIPRRGIKNIRFDDPEQNFMQMGLQYESKKQWGEALAYYEKALELNPSFQDALKASARVRNQFWSQAAAGPVDEIERRQSLYDSWARSSETTNGFKKESKKQTEDVRQKLGLSLERKEDWTCVADVVPGRDAAVAGIRKRDKLISLDGISLRYLNVSVVESKLLSQRSSHFTIEFERNCRVRKTGVEKSWSELGMELKLEDQGVVVQSVKPGTAASKAGMKAGDIVVEVNGVAMRYLPLKKLMSVVHKNPSDAIFAVRRSALLYRK